jgi:hypothetical protein
MTKKDRIEKQRLKVEQQICLWEEVTTGTSALKEWFKLMDLLDKLIQVAEND